MAEEGTGNGNEGGTEGVSPEQLEQWGANLASMQQLMNTMMAKVAALEDAPSAGDEPPAAAAPPTFDASNLEEMSREQFAKTLLEQVSGGIQSVKDDLAKQLDGVKHSVRKVSAQADVRETSGKHADFWSWRDEMKGLADKHPTMSAEDLYQMARSANPDKAKQVDAEHQPKTEETPSDGKGATEGVTRLFGGMAPTSGETEETSSMKPEDAAEKAWQETMSGLGEVLNQ